MLESSNEMGFHKDSSVFHKCAIHKFVLVPLNFYDIILDQRHLININDSIDRKYKQMNTLQCKISYWYIINNEKEKRKFLLVFKSDTNCQKFSDPNDYFLNIQYIF